MSRLLIDPSMPNGAKFAGASDLAKLLHFLGLCYAASNLSDGFVPEPIARKLTRADRKQFDRAIAHLSSVQPGCDHPSWEARPGGWFLHDYDDPLYDNPMREGLEKRREQKVKAGAAGGKKSALARLEKYGTAQPPSSKPEAEPEAPPSKLFEAPASNSASAAATTSPEADSKLARAGAHAQPLPSSPSPSTPDPSATPGTSGVKEMSGEHGDNAVLVASNGDASRATLLRTDAVHLVDWLLVNRGDHTFGSREEQESELTTATQMLQLGQSYPQILAHLKRYRAEMDPDDIASSLSYYYVRIQDDVHTALKQKRGPHVDSGPTKLSESLPDIQGKKGSKA